MKRTALGDAANVGNWLRHFVLGCAIIATLVPIGEYHPWTKTLAFAEKIFTKVAGSGAPTP